MATMRITVDWAERASLGRLLPAATTAGRYTLVFVAGVLVFALILLADGHNAYDALKTMYDNSIASEFGRQEILVKIIPFGLCAAAADMSITIAGPIRRDSGTASAVVLPSAKWIGASRCVPPCSGAVIVFDA